MATRYYFCTSAALVPEEFTITIPATIPGTGFFEVDYAQSNGLFKISFDTGHGIANSKWNAGTGSFILGTSGSSRSLLATTLAALMNGNPWAYSGAPAIVATATATGVQVVDSNPANFGYSGSDSSSNITFTETQQGFLYGNDWDRIANWWTNSSHTSPLGSLPGASDTCELLGAIAPIVTVDDGAFQCPATIDGSGLTNTNSSVLTITGTSGITLESSAPGAVAITGDVRFIGNVSIGQDQAISVTGDMLLQDYANMYGLVTVNGNVQCHGNSYSEGQINGNADYWGNAFNNYAIITGVWTYHSIITAHFSYNPTIGDGGVAYGGYTIQASPQELQPI